MAKMGVDTKNYALDLSSLDDTISLIGVCAYSNVAFQFVKHYPA